MRLSAAMRKGALMAPQAMRTFFSLETGGTCAFGAALEGVGYPLREEQPNNLRFEFIRATWPETREANVRCPECGEQSNLHDIVAGHLNNRHWWSRERIAGWLEVLEDKRETFQDEMDRELLSMLACSPPTPEEEEEPVEKPVLV